MGMDCTVPDFRRTQVWAGEVHVTVTQGARAQPRWLTEQISGVNDFPVASSLRVKSLWSHYLPLFS